VEGLVGRAVECERLDQLLREARTGLSGTLVLRGEPGVGKTSLLHYLAASAPDFEVARVSGVESEMKLSFAALHQLLRPSLATTGELPPPQRSALRLAFGLEDGGPPDGFLVGLAALGLLAGRAAARPLLCLVDDAHWLDHESAAALAFLARRLYADSIVMVFAVREPAPGSVLLEGLPELRLAGLDESAAGQLLVFAAGPVLDGPGRPEPRRDERGAGELGVDGSGLDGSRLEKPQLDEVVRQRIVAETRGNPLALIEIGQALEPGQLTGSAPLPEPLPLGRQLEQRYLQEIRGLPPGTQTLLLAAAADPTGDPDLLWRAGPRLGFTTAAAAPAEARRLIEIRDRIEFRHPLIRSAVFYGAPLAARQQVHAALAAATDQAADPDRRAWHLAMAASGLDEAVAAELEQAGERARRRGGWTTAEAFYKRAAMLSTSQPGRARRMLSAAGAACDGGTPRRAQAMLDEAATYRDPRHHGQVERVQGRIWHTMRRPADATAALLDAAAELGPVDVRLARDILVEAVVQAQINGQLAPDGATPADVAQAARSLPLPPGTPATVGDLLLDADTTLQLHGLQAAAPQLRQAISAARHEAGTAPESFRWLAAACSDATILADDIALHELAWRMEAQAREQGAAIALSLALSHAGVSELLAGRMAEAQRCFHERVAIEEARGRDWSIGPLLVAAWRGQAGPAETLLDTVAQEAARQGQGYQLAFAGYARCVLELGRGQYEHAHASLTGGVQDGSQIKFVLPDLVEAAERSGHRAAALRLTSQLAGLAEASPVPRTLGFLARAQALTARDVDAEPLYQAAIAHHSQTRGPAHRARSHLLYGEWLRRGRRPRDAREQLRTAYRLFAEMGAQGFAARARLELSAAGETVAPAAAEVDHGLTPQESRVASLAAAGATNAEIAAQLYLSASTVDYHLRKVFRKLGVTSRRQLARGDPARAAVLRQPDDPARSAAGTSSRGGGPGSWEPRRRRTP
jgi:DNA-binding CsgD family transcriptional regulator